MHHIVMVFITAILLATSFSCGYKEKQAAQQAQLESQRVELQKQKRELEKLKQPQF